MLHTLLVLQASHGELGLRVNLLACIADVRQKPRICTKSGLRKDERKAFLTGFKGPEVMKLTQHIIDFVNFGSKRGKQSS